MSGNKKRCINNEEELDVDIHPGYKELVLDACQNNLDFDIPNSSVKHAIFLSKLLIKNATASIKIFTGELEEIFYNDKSIRDAIKDVVERGNIEMTIIVENYDKIKNQEFLNFAKNNNIRIKRLKTPTKVDTHFLLSDSSSYRIEWPHTTEDFNNNYKVKGQANFNNSKMGGMLSDAFEYLSQNSTAI